MANEISKNSNKKYIVLSIIVITIVVLLVAGGTYAFLSEDFGATNGNYAYNTACFDIVYDVTNEDGASDITGTLIPSSSARGGLTGRVSIGLEEGCKTYAYGDIFLNVSSASTILTQTVDAHCENIVTLESMSSYTTESDCTSQTNGIWVTNGTALKYAVYKESKDEPISVGYINSSSQVIDIYKEFNVEEQIDYDIYIWLDGNLIDNSYTSLSFGGNISASVTQIEAPLPEKPDLDQNGMIPVIISDNGTVTTIDKDDDNWYNYSNKEWANAILVTDISRGTYRGTSGVTVSESDILAYYVWIPRYKYELWTTTVSSAGSEQTINIKFENSETSMSVGTTIGSYRTHPAFWWDDDNDGTVDAGEVVSGIWVGKFEITGDETIPTVKPNSASLVNQTVSKQFETSRKFSTDASYGLTITNAHMMKNSEWGAAAYLSHSLYGTDDEVRINNYWVSSATLTGCGAAIENAAQNNTECEIPYGSAADGTYLQSTTGNISGVFDMSGGAWEYVMGHYGYTITENDYSGFSVMPSKKYYDKYDVASSLSCTLLVCVGHSFYETENWYGDLAYFVTSDNPWFRRGGSYEYDSRAGVFSFNHYNGESYINRSFRSVYVVGFGE